MHRRAEARAAPVAAQRADLSLPFRNYGASDVPLTNKRLPLDAHAAEQYGAHILPRFCSQPIPELVTRKRLDGYTSFDVQSREIGRRSSIDMTFGNVYRNCPFARDLDGAPLYQADMRLSTPSRTLVSCLLVHRPGFGTVRPTLMTFRQTPGDDDARVALSAPQLEPYADVRFLGNASLAFHTPEIPQHDEMIRYAFNELGWNAEEFDAFTVRIDYPVLHCVVRVQFRVTI